MNFFFNEFVTRTSKYLDFNFITFYESALFDNVDDNVFEIDDIIIY